ncbi:hypothetical protein Lser_V15G03790 [Lactuca serriola]
MVKIQPLADVEEKVFRSLGWTKLDFLNKRHVETNVFCRGSEESEIQISNGPSISFTIPSSSNNLTGLNFCCVLASPFHQQPLNNLPKIIISNITKTRTWICHHYLEMVFLRRNGLTLLSHWMLGMNEMECGNHVTVTVRWTPHDIGDAVIKECGVSFVYDDGEEEEKEEEVLGYYKSWNHIIVGDLTAFQTTTGEYILSKWRILHPYMDINMLRCDYLCGDGARFKSECSSELSLEESLYWRMTPKVITRIAYRAKFLGAWERGVTEG